MSDHLVVLVHGLWGKPEHLWCIEENLRAAHPDANLLLSKSNLGNRTYDGVDVCGERIAEEVQEEVKRLEKDGTEIERISFVGYSFGGLASRYCVGVLQALGFFNSVEPVNFTTFAAPHVGVCPPKKGFFSYLVSSVGPRSLSVTGAHIFLADSVLRSRPLLEVMTDPESTFYKGLARFKSRALYANITNDRSVPYFTACIDSCDPYTDLDKIVLHSDHSHSVLLDEEKPYTMARPEQKMIKNTVPISYREITFQCILLLGFPIWITLFAANAIVAVFRSSRRITAHRDARPERPDSMFSSLTQEFVEDVMDDSGPPTDMQLNSHQVRIVANLNTLRWQKYRVRIQKTRHAHAAIVSRMRNAPHVSEGREVMRHWLDKVFIP